MIIHECNGTQCPVCGGPIGVGLKEEPSCWKVYEVCLTEERRCVDRRAGTVPKSAVGHDDGVFERAASFVGLGSQ